MSVRPVVIIIRPIFPKAMQTLPFMFSQSIAIKITKGAYTLTTVCDKSLPPTVCRREATVESGCNNFWSSVYSRLLFCSFASMLRVYKMAQLTTQWQASPHPPPRRHSYTRPTLLRLKWCARILQLNFRSSADDEERTAGELRRSAHSWNWQDEMKWRRERRVGRRIIW